MDITVSAPLALVVRRRQRGHSAAQGAAELGITVSYLSRIERDRARPSAELAGTIEDRYGIPAGEWFPGEPAGRDDGEQAHTAPAGSEPGASAAE